jgi:UDP-N-acetylmuramoyl-tripeptide--D-alanyl-D-alanine ligase
MRFSARLAAEATGGELVGPDVTLDGASFDSRTLRPGQLFVPLVSERDGHEFIAAAVAAGAPAYLTARPVEEAAASAVAVEDTARALLDLGRWGRDRLASLGGRVVGVTGSVGKTSVKDIARALLPSPVHANRENLNTEIGLPLTVLEAPEETRTMVLEMAMRGPGQIAELASIAEPEIAVITNVGPVHVELLGSVEAIAAAKAEVLEALPPDGTAIVPVAAGALESHLAVAPNLLRFGPGGDVQAVESSAADGITEALVEAPNGRQLFHLPFTEPHNLDNALAAVAAGVALGAPLAEMADRAANIGFSRFRGERLEMGDGIVLVNDCYNANPVSMRAALDHLASTGSGRRIAVLGEMAELGPGAPDYHREIGERSRDLGISMLIGVGAPARDYAPDELVATPLEAAELLAAQLEPGDTVLVKGSRSAGLEAVAEALEELVDG